MKGIKLNGATIKAGLKTAGKVIEKNAPAITAGLAIAALFGAVWQAAKAGGEVKAAIEEAELKKNEKALAERMDPDNFSDETPIVELTWKERGFIYAKHYWKAVLLALLSAGCMIGSVWFGNRQLKALSVIAAAAETKLIDLESATKAVVGEKKFEQIKSKFVEEEIEKNPPKEGFIANTGCGNTLCFEPVFGTWYWSDISAVDKAYVDYYDLYVHSEAVLMEDLYNLLHIPKEYRPKLLDQLGHMYDQSEGIELKPEYTPRSFPVTMNGQKYVCYAMDLTIPRRYDELVNEQYAKRSFRAFR